MPVDVQGTAFQSRVWKALRQIPLGDTVSYSDVAQRLGAPAAVRAAPADDEPPELSEKTSDSLNKLQPLLDAKILDPESAAKHFGADAARLARNLSHLGEFGLTVDWTPEQGLEAGQAEALRKMLLAVIGDVRLVVVRLATQLQKMRAAKSLSHA